MTKQKGQSMVEFAFIAPFVIFMFLGLIYGGILFMDYIQYNNAARAIARSAAFKEETDFNEDGTIKPAIKTKLKEEYFHPLTTLYTATLDSVKRTVVRDTESNAVIKREVTVKITFERAENLGVFGWLGFPPETLKDVVYTMPVETLVEPENEEGTTT